MSGLSPAAQGHLLMLVYSALIAGSFSLGGQIAHDIAPEALTAVRFILAAVIIAGMALVFGELNRDAFRAPWRHLILGTLLGLFFVLMFEGLKTAPPVSASAVFTLAPIVSGIAGWVLLRQVATPRMVLALLIGGAGAIWVIFRADVAALLAFRIGTGEAIFFWGCVAHAIYTPMMAKLARGAPPVAFACGVMVSGALVVTAYGWRGIIATDWTALRPMVWITLAYLVVFASVTTLLILRFASLRLPSAKVMAYIYLTPSWAMVWELAQGRVGAPLAVLPGIAVTLLALALLLRDDSAGRAPRAA